MKIWKRLVSGALSGALVLGLLTGCQAGKSANSTKSETASETAVSEGAVPEEASSEGAALKEAAKTGRPAGAITLTDQAGRTVTLEEPADRLVSSYYISTALLVALGLEDHLAAIEKKADTRELYKLAAPGLLEIPGVGTSKEINVEETAKAEPDLVILPLRLQESAPSFEELGIPVLIVNPETQEDFENCLTLLAEATGTVERGEELLSYYRDKMQEARDLVKDLERPTVYFSSASDYFSTCTSKMYQNQLIENAGGDNVSKELEDGYWKVVSPEQVMEWNPQYMFCTADAEYRPEDIKNDGALAEVDAVKDGRVYRFPSTIEAWDYPTPSSVLGVLWLTHVLHPEVYTEERYAEEARNFYKNFFDVTVTDEQLGL